MAYIDKKITYEHDDNGKNKKFAYKPNTVSNGHDPYPNVIPIGPIPHEKPWWLEDCDQHINRQFLVIVVETINRFLKALLLFPCQLFRLKVVYFS